MFLLIQQSSFILLLTIISCNNSFRSNPNKKDVIVDTQNGKVLGRTFVTVDLHKQYHAFEGIPYAQPPVGKLRFQPPLSVKNWNYTLNAIKNSTQCVQGTTIIKGSEDCLLLSVYTPYLPEETITQLLPVMVYIHGGIYLKGSSSYSLYAPDYFLEQDVAVVTLNYRLGIFGFLSTGDLAAPGNYGLKDQVLALKWVQNNIKNFGGNPCQVTLFGQSAGSSSVSYHLQSELSKGLFQQAIMQSGTTLCPWALSRKASQATRLVAKELKIPMNTSQTLVDNLRHVSYIKLQKVAIGVNNKLFIHENPANGVVFGPVNEVEHSSSFFTGKSHDMLTHGEFHQNVPLMVGFNRMEGSVDITLTLRLWLTTVDGNNTILVLEDMNVNPNRINELTKNIKQYYFGDIFPISLQNNAILQFITDTQFIHPIRETVYLQSKYTPVYFYRFAYEGLLGGNQAQSKLPGPEHSEELPYMWRSKNKATAKDILIRKRMIRMWTNFAKYGNPTPKSDALLDNVVWPRANVFFGDLAYLNIDDKMSIQFNPRKDAMKYWNNIYEEYGNPPFDTY